MSQLCRAYDISRPTSYKWLRRYQSEGREGLRDRSRRPHRSPKQTPKAIEQLVVEARQQHPAWGGRKLKRWLQNRGHSGLPAPSTISEILRRKGMLDEEESRKHRAYIRFERDAPNQLWQMDYKGHFALADNSHRCHPLTIVDDHARFLLGLRACADETHLTVQSYLTAVFRLYGLPVCMLMDNGAPWGNDADTHHTILSVWLLQLSVDTIHGRPYHPQTQGKVERLHRTLDDELLSRNAFHSLTDCQTAFDRWRHLYNHERPHDALDLDTPVTRYQPSQRTFPEILPPLTFPSGAVVRKVFDGGRINFHARRLRVGRAFVGQSVGLVYDELQDGLVHVYFNNIHIRSLDLQQAAL